MSTLTGVERAVLRAYQQEGQNDPDGAFAPYYHSIAAAANDVDLAYATCKKLKARGYLAATGAARGGLLNAPSYWITDAGREALS